MTTISVADSSTSPHGLSPSYGCQGTFPGSELLPRAAIQSQRSVYVAAVNQSPCAFQQPVGVPGRPVGQGGVLDQASRACNVTQRMTTRRRVPIDDDWSAL